MSDKAERILLQKVDGLAARLDKIIDFVNTTNIEHALEKLVAQFEDLRREVAENGSVIQAAIIFIRGLNEKIAAAGNDPEALQALVNELNANEQQLASAISANTPMNPENSAPAPTPAPELPPVEAPVVEGVDPANVPSDAQPSEPAPEAPMSDTTPDSDPTLRPPE